MFNHAPLKAVVEEIIAEFDGDGLVLVEADVSRSLEERLTQAMSDLLTDDAEHRAIVESATLQAMRDMIAASQANDGDALANAITAE